MRRRRRAGPAAPAERPPRAGKGPLARLDRKGRRALVWAAVGLGVTWFVAYPSVALLGLGIGRLVLWPTTAGILASLVPLFVTSKWLPSRKGMRRWAYWGVFYLMLQGVIGPGWGGWQVLNYLAAALLLYGIAAHVNRVLKPRGPRWSQGWHRHRMKQRFTPDPWVTRLRGETAQFRDAGQRVGLRAMLNEERWDTAWLESHEDRTVPRAATWALYASWAAWGGFVAWQVVQLRFLDPGVQVLVILWAGANGAAWAGLRFTAWWLARENRAVRERLLAQAEPWRPRASLMDGGATPASGPGEPAAGRAPATAETGMARWRRGGA